MKTQLPNSDVPCVECGQSPRRPHQLICDDCWQHRLEAWGPAKGCVHGRQLNVPCPDCRAETKVDYVEIINWKAPGEEWWDGVMSKPNEPLIQSKITMTLSWQEYSDLLKLRASSIEQESTCESQG